MKIYLPTFFVFLFSLSVMQAQVSPRISLKTGVSFSNQTYTHSNDTLSFNPDYKNLTGVPIVIGFDLFSKKGLRLGLQTMYQQKGTTTKIGVSDDEFNPGEVRMEKVTARYDYLSISIPVGYAYPLSRKIGLVATVAPRIDFDLNRNSDSQYFIPIEGREKVIFGLNGNIGVEFKKKQWVISAQAHYQYDITPFDEVDIRDQNNQPISTLTTKNRLSAFLVGVGYCL